MFQLTSVNQLFFFFFFQSLEVKSEVKDEEETWNILRADFLGDAPMQDWDKVTDV